MKWSICLLLALAVVWLGWPGVGEREKGAEVVQSSRRGLDHEWRAKPEREMAIGDMQRA